MAHPIIGSDGWDSDAEDSAKRAISGRKWEQSVLTLCKSLRGGVGCTVGLKYRMGTQNIVKLIEFEDGEKWVIRIPLGDDDAVWAASISQRIENEVATYNYLKKHTSIPVPAVHAYSSNIHHDIGSAFILMTYLHGTVADEFHFDAHQKLHFWKQVAAMVLELASHKFDRIGGLVEDGFGAFSIGKDMETNRGPFRTAGEFYSAVSRHRFQGYADNNFEDNLEAEQVPGLPLPFMFNSFMQMFTDCGNDTGPFSLTNTDCGSHNILLDADYNIVGLIDCDNIIAAPIHQVAQVPRLGNVRMLPPGLQTRKPLLIETFKERKFEYTQYVELFKTTEADVGAGTRISDAMESDGASLVAGLEDYAGREWSSCNEWVRSYLHIYYRRLCGGSSAKVFSEAHVPQDGTASEKGDIEDEESSSDESEESEAAPQEWCNAEPQTASAVETAIPDSVDEVNRHEESSPVVSTAHADHTA